MTAAPPADRDLLDRFLRTRDEAAFAELVRRHAPGVWGACRRRLDTVQDAEDAFQAAFLVLVRRAGRLRADAPLGPWLGKVAALTARNVLRGNRRRVAVSGPLGHDVPAAVAAEPAVDLDAALGGLPEADRTAVVLCHLDGLSRKEAAERLGCPEGTLSARLSRALGKLRARLADEVPAGLVRTTVRVVVVAGAAGSAGVSPAVARLAEEALRMVWVKKLSAAGLVLAAAGMVGLGVTRTADAGGQDKPAPAAAKADKPAADRVAELEARVKELEEALKQARFEAFRLQLQGESVTKFLGESLAPPVGMEKGDPPAVAAKKAPPPPPKAEKPVAADERDELRKQLAAAKENLTFLRAANESLVWEMMHLQEQLRARPPAAKPADLPAVAAKKAPPAASPAGRIAELERQFQDANSLGALMEVEKARLSGELERLRAPAPGAPRPATPPNPAEPVIGLEQEADLADQTAKAAEHQAVVAARRRDAARERLAAARKAAEAKKPAAADLTLVILGDESSVWVARYQLTENQGGKPVFYLTPSPEGLAKLLARAKADPNGPKTVAVRAEKECKPEDIRAGLLALKAAGFKTADYDGPTFEGDFTSPGPGTVVPGPKAGERGQMIGPIDLPSLKLPPAPKKE